MFFNTSYKCWRFCRVRVILFFLSDFLFIKLMLIYTMFPAATAVTVARNVARRGVFSHFCLCVQVLLSLATFSNGLTRSAVTEARRRATVCHGWFYVSSRPATFCWDLSRFVTLRSSSATSIKFCQGFLR